MKKPTTEQILYKVIDAISSIDINEILEKVDTIVADITNADSTGIYTLDDKSNSVVLRASIMHSSLIGNLKMKMNFGITGWVAEHGDTIVIEKDAPKDPRFGAVPELKDDLFETFLSVPIKNGNIVIGVINIKHKIPTKYSKELVELIEMIGKLVGKAIDYSVLLEKTENLEEALKIQKIISKAKGILMDKLKVSENDAYHTLRKQAMKNNKSIKEIAESIITSDQILN